jgi:hypothetical protein
MNLSPLMFNLSFSITKPMYSMQSKLNRTMYDNICTDIPAQVGRSIYTSLYRDVRLNIIRKYHAII